MKPSCGLRPGDTPPERPEKQVPPAKTARTAPALETFNREYGSVPYEDPLALLRDIRECLAASVRSPVQDGPWLPTLLRARIDRALHRDTHALDDETRAAVATLQDLGVMDKPVHGGYPDVSRPHYPPADPIARKLDPYPEGTFADDETREAAEAICGAGVLGAAAVVVGHKGETVGSVGPTFVSHREEGVPPATFHAVGRILPASRLKPVRGLSSGTFEECTHFVAPVNSYYRFNTSHGVPLTIWLKKGDSVRSSISEDVCCPDCGAGDDAHHSFSCPTGLHPDRVADRGAREVILESTEDELRDAVGNEKFDALAARGEDAVAEAMREVNEEVWRTTCTCKPGSNFVSASCPVHAEEPPKATDLPLPERED